MLHDTTSEQSSIPSPRRDGSCADIRRAHTEYLTYHLNVIIINVLRSTSSGNIDSLVVWVLQYEVAECLFTGPLRGPYVCLLDKYSEESQEPNLINGSLQPRVSIMRDENSENELGGPVLILTILRQTTSV